MKQVTMADLNKHANAIINQAHLSGEPVTILKHGKPIARITPIQAISTVENALSYLTNIQTTTVNENIESVIDTGRRRGIYNDEF